MFFCIRFTVRKWAVPYYPRLRGGLFACAEHAEYLRGYADDLLAESEGGIIRYTETVSDTGTCGVCEDPN